MTATFDLGTGRGRFDLVPGRSAVLVEARSNVGPIAFGTTALNGHVEAAIIDAAVDPDAAPSARLAFELRSLRSGNALYDAELLRRVDGRRHPTTTVELREAVRIGASDRYSVTGDLTFHGVTRSASGTVAVAVRPDHALEITGEHVFDIRDFDLSAPTVLMLRIYPDVRVQLQLLARPNTEVRT
jgi:polyisoprenoid-binding protein YceI